MYVFCSVALYTGVFLQYTARNQFQPELGTDVFKPVSTEITQSRHRNEYARACPIGQYHRFGYISRASKKIPALGLHRVQTQAGLHSNPRLEWSAQPTLRVFAEICSG